MNIPNAPQQNSSDDEFSQRARTSLYGDYLMVFSALSSGSTLNLGQVPAQHVQRLVWALAAHDAKRNELRSLIEYEERIERLKKTVAEAADASSYGGSDSGSEDRPW